MDISVDAFLRHWKSLQFDNESDVREEFVTPLLWTLGYAKNTVNDIVREKHFKLGTKGYSMRGSQRVRVDYIPTLRLKRFWLIEAKLGDDCRWPRYFSRERAVLVILICQGVGHVN